MRFLLLIVLLAPGPDESPTVSQIEFSTMERCEKEREQLSETFEKAGLRFVLQCVDTGSRV